MSDEDLKDDEYILYLSDFEEEYTEDLETDVNSGECSTSKRARRESQTPDLFDPKSPSWTAYERKLMLEALKEYGTSSIKAVKNNIPTKNEAEIKEFFIRQIKTATNSLKDSKDIKNKEKSAIDRWILFLTKKYPQESYKFNYIARVMKYIALFEKREPTDDESNQVNLR